MPGQLRTDAYPLVIKIEPKRETDQWRRVSDDQRFIPRLVIINETIRQYSVL